MRFRVLGALEILGPAGPVVPKPRKQRVLLGALVLHANAPLSASFLVECLWDGRPPRSARANLQSYVTALRRLLPEPDALSTVPDGYRLHVEPHDVDALVFERLVAEAHQAAEPAIAAKGFDEALQLWRGDVLAGTELPAPLRPAATRLQELRLTAMEDRGDALLHLRDTAHPDLVAELVRQTEANPLRERLQGQLMLALQRAGRTAEALAVFRAFRDRLVDDLGVEPGPSLQELHRRILNGSPEPSPDPAPQTLPPDVRDLVGRDDVLAALDRLDAPVVLIAGPAGAGKTALAVHWAYRAAARFPDGQLYVNLRGWSHDAPLSSLAALTLCLRALRIPAAQIPVDLDEAVALYRSVLARRRLLLVLDNARTAEQVRPLLPAGDTCVAVVTSRDRLTGLVALNHAHRIALAPLSAGDAVALLRAAVPANLPDGPLAELAEACGRLPLALRIAAAKLSDQPDGDLATYAQTLGRLSALEIDGDPDASVRAAFDVSFEQLTEPQRRLFGLLGLVPGADFTAATAGALLGGPPGAAQEPLDALVSTHLIEPHRPGRYALHDLLRQYAGAVGTPDEEAVRRLGEHYLAGLEGGAALMWPHFLRLPGERVPPTTFPDAPAADAWLDAEVANIAALVHRERGSLAWRLADALRGYFWIRRPMAMWLAVASDGLTAATAAGDDHAIAAMRLSLGLAERSVGHAERAEEHLAAALAASERAGWPKATGSILNSLAWTYVDEGRNAKAIELLGEVLALNRRIGNPGGEAIALGNRAALLYQLGDLRGAEAGTRETLPIHREIGSKANEALSYANLGVILIFRGAYDEAEACFAEHSRLNAAIGDPISRAASQYGRARMHADLGDHAAAARHAGIAAELAHAAGDVMTHTIAELELALAQHRLGLDVDVVDRCAAARREAHSAGNAFAEAWGAIGLARAALLTGRVELAQGTAREAVAAAGRGGYRLLEGEARCALAEALLAGGDRTGGPAMARAATEVLAGVGYPAGERRARKLWQGYGAAVPTGPNL